MGPLGLPSGSIRSRMGLGAIALLLILLSACAGPRYDVRGDIPGGKRGREPAVARGEGGYHSGSLRPYTVRGKTYYPRIPDRYEETGVASWYGDAFHGKPTSNGEVFNMWALSAAHKTLPLPSVVEVTNLENGRSIRVRVNDRGPFIDGRLIDLSRGAAEDLGILRQGMGKVRVRWLGRAEGGPITALRSERGPERTTPGLPSAPEGPFTVQVGAFGERNNAARLVDQLREAGVDDVTLVRVHPGLWRVIVGRFDQPDAAERVRQSLRDLGYGQAVITRRP
ncbi:MAG: septal ring lytic transglycosylase RlpA family protein [Asticcacaulis sp.]